MELNNILKAIKKGITIADVIKAVNLTKKVGINHKVNFIIGHPMESYNDALDSIRLAEKLECSFVGFNNLIPYPGSEAYRLISTNPKAKFISSPETYLNQLTHKKTMPVFETNNFPKEEIDKALGQGFELEERTLARFRFGRIKGYIAYLVSRHQHIFKPAIWLFQRIISTRLGSAGYNMVVKPPW